MLKYHLKFLLGNVVVTSAALKTIPSADIEDALKRHGQGDWGDLTPTEKHANDLALLHGHSLHSAYSASNGVRLWIITEPDRSVTTVLLPKDY